MRSQAATSAGSRSV